MTTNLNPPYHEFSNGGVGRSGTSLIEILSPRTMRAPGEKQSSCLLERISRLQGRLNERIALAGQSALDHHRKSEAERKSIHRNRSDTSSLYSESTNRIDGPISIRVFEASATNSFQSVESPRISSLSPAAELIVKAAKPEFEVPNAATTTNIEDGKVDQSNENTTFFHQFFSKPQLESHECLRTKEEEIAYLSAELKNMQEKLVRMEKKAFTEKSPCDGSTQEIDPTTESSRLVCISTQTDVCNGKKSQGVCEKCEILQIQLDETLKKCKDKSHECSDMSSWITEISLAVHSCAVHVLSEKFDGKAVNPAEDLELKDTKRLVDLIIQEINLTAQRLEAANDQLQTAHCLDNIFRANASAESKSGFSLPLTEDKNDKLFSQALSWVKRSLTLEEQLRERDRDISHLHCLLEAEQYKSPDLEPQHSQNAEIQAVLEQKCGQLEAEVSLLRGRVKALTHELDAMKSRSRTLKSVIFAEEDDCFDERDEVHAKHLEQYELLGTGAFAEVYKGWWRRPVAIKKFRNLTTQSKLDSFAREVRIHRPLDHPGIIQFYGVCTDLPDMYIVLECVSGSSFHKLCHERNGLTWDLEEILGLCLQLSEVMSYVHAQNVVHRDLKPPNVLVSEAGFVKLIDFGLAYAGDPSRIPKSSVYAGTPVYLPPEVLREEAVTRKVDLYSFAVILWEMASQELPWQGVTMAHMIAAVAGRDERPPMPAGLPAGLRDLIRACWAPDPADRPEFDEVGRLLRGMGAPPAPIRQRAQFQTIQAM